ncbi:hypothetical protein AB4Y45_16335 [Paraburkholderia sp. EG287A]|uniref:hypothetical protein n=1 Tax=unclassified Paraburkholderia TaxID=2615204 RepID=UPI0034D1E973
MAVSTGASSPDGSIRAASCSGPTACCTYRQWGCPYSSNPDEPNVGYVLRFNAATGAFVDQFASNQTVPELHRPEGLVFDKDGNLWVTSFRGVSGGSDQILKLSGKTGARLDSLVLWAGTAPRAYAKAILFGPGNKLYIPISSGDPTTAGQLRRCDVATKACAIIAPAGNPLQIPDYLIFKNSDPATLDYGGGE